MDDRPRDLPAGERPVARLADDRPPERRPVHELSAPDPAADGQDVPRRAACRSCIRTRRRERAAELDRANYTLYEIAIITRAGARAPARACAIAAISARARRRISPCIARSRTASACSPRQRTCSRTAQLVVARRPLVATPTGGTTPWRPSSTRHRDAAATRYSDAVPHRQRARDRSRSSDDEICGLRPRRPAAAIAARAGPERHAAQRRHSSTTPSPKPSR